MQRILAAQPLHPEKVTHYWERRDPDLKPRIRAVLLVDQQVALQSQNGVLAPLVITLSVDEKPGWQALENTAPGVPPVPGRHASLGGIMSTSDSTCSILAALDLQTGQVTGRVERRHRRREFIALLNDLDDYYPVGCTIRLILYNHSAHISKETQGYLATRPNRFKNVLTPKHGGGSTSWKSSLGDDTNLPAEHPRAVVGRTSRTHPEGHRRDQC